MATDETVGRGSKGESEAEEIVEDAASGRVEDVGEHYVHGVLGPHGSRAEHREPQLHRKHEVGREEQVRGVHRSLSVAVGGIDAADCGANVRGRRGWVGGVGAKEAGQLISGAAGSGHWEGRFRF